MYPGNNNNDGNGNDDYHDNNNDNNNNNKATVEVNLLRTFSCVAAFLQIFDKCVKIFEKCVKIFEKCPVHVTSLQFLLI